MKPLQLIALYFLILQFLFATSPPKRCAAPAPVGYVESFEFLFVSESGLLVALIVMAIYLLFVLVRQVQLVSALNVRFAFAKYVGAFLLAGMLFIWSSGFFLLFMISGGLRNDCRHCLIGRPTSVLFEFIPGIIVMIVTWLLYRLLSRLNEQVISFGLKLSLPSIGLLLWLALILLANSVYSKIFCMESALTP